MKPHKKPIFVVQKHESSHMHYDFRIEIGGILKSWAVPKGVPTSSKDKRLAILTTDHKLSYAKFEGMISEGKYGAGKVSLWDEGTFENKKLDEHGKEISLKKCFDEGVIKIELKGKKVKGIYVLAHFKEKSWLLMKKG